jgi:hypothetical protein
MVTFREGRAEAGHYQSIFRGWANSAYSVSVLNSFDIFETIVVRTGVGALSSLLTLRARKASVPSRDRARQGMRLTVIAIERRSNAPNRIPDL